MKEHVKKYWFFSFDFQANFHLLSFKRIILGTKSNTFKNIKVLQKIKYPYKKVCTMEESSDSNLTSRGAYRALAVWGSGGAASKKLFGLRLSNYCKCGENHS